MLSLLFDAKFWYWLLILGFIGAMVYLCVKYKQARLFSGIIAGVAVLVFTGYCCIEINSYYSASGGVFGFIGEVLHPNTVEKLGDFSYSVNNLMLTQKEDGEYSVTIYTNDIVTLDNAKIYGVYVNGIPTTQVHQKEDFLQADFRYQFYDDDATTLLCDDVMKINFAFYDNLTYIKLSTAGGTNTLDGQSTVNYWNSYFSKNKMTVEVKEIGYCADNENEVVDGDISNFNVRKYYIDDELYNIEVFKTGETVGISRLWEYNGKDVTMWEYINGAYYAYTYEELDFKVEGEKLLEYTGNTTGVVVPTSYSLFRDKYPIAGTDIPITTIGTRCFNSTLENLVISSKIQTIEAGAFDNAVNLTNVYVDSYDIYSQLTSNTACGSILQYTTEVQILASIDDGANLYLSDTEKYTKYTAVLDGKEYNRYVEVIDTDDNQNVCTVNYYDKDGELLDTQRYTYGDELVFTTAYVETPESYQENGRIYYYVLDGWQDTKGNCYYTGSTSSVISDLELSPVWQIKSRIPANPV